MPEYDLDYHGLKIGFARVGKSTLCLQEIRRRRAYMLGTRDLNAADRYLIDHDFAHNNMAYSKKQNIKKMFGSLAYGDDFLFDEGYLTADRRTSLDRATVAISQTVNLYASKNAAVHTCIQNLTDLDRRFFAKANSIDVLVERGKSLCFCGSKNFPLIKDFYGFERFFDTPYMLSSYESGVYNLMRLPSFVGVKHWVELDGCKACGHIKHEHRKCRDCACVKYACENAFFAHYAAAKTAYQDENYADEVEGADEGGKAKV